MKLLPRQRERAKTPIHYSQELELGVVTVGCQASAASLKQPKGLDPRELPLQLPWPVPRFPAGMGVRVSGNREKRAWAPEAMVQAHPPYPVLHAWTHPPGIPALTQSLPDLTCEARSTNCTF